MKILELNFEKTWRGGERQTLYCLRGFRQNGTVAEVLCRTGYPMHQKAESEGFTVHHYNNILGVIFFLLTKARHYDVLHAETAGVLTYCVFTKVFHRTKVVYTRRVDFVPSGFFTKLKYNLTDKLVAISKAIEHILTNFTTTDVSLISESVIERNINKTDTIQLLNNDGIDTSKTIIGTIAALEQHKDPLIMVAAIHELKKRGMDFVFVHFGGGRLEEQVKEKIAELGVGDVYKLMGFRDNVEDFFSVFDVFVMSSEQEGLGSSVLDAFIYKVPVVATKAGGLNDLLGDNRGILCEIKNPAELADGIEKMMVDEAFRRTTVQRAYDYVVTHHNINHITAKYLSLFREIQR